MRELFKHKAGGSSGPPAAIIALSPSSLTFAAEINGPVLPATQDVAITNGGGGVLDDATLTINYVSGSGWLSATQSGTGNAQAATEGITANVAVMAPGTYTADVSVDCANASNTPQTIGVTLNLTAGHFSAPSNVALSGVDPTGFLNLNHVVTAPANQPDQDGNANSAYLISQNNATNIHQSWMNASVGYTRLGMFVKQYSARYLTLWKQGDTANYAYIDAQTGVSTSVGAGIASTSVGYANNGFYFFEVEFVSATSATGVFQISDTVQVAGASYAGSGSGLVLYGFEAR